MKSDKSAVTKHCNRLGLNMIWQTNFYDVIIRNEDMYHKIKEYIKNNPMNWEKDKFHPSENGFIIKRKR